MVRLSCSDSKEVTREKVRQFVDRKIYSYSNDFDETQVIPDYIFREMADAGFMAASLSQEWNGICGSASNFGEICSEIARGSGSLLSLIAVHGMVCFAIEKFGSLQQKRFCLAKLASGEYIGAFGLSEPEAGSDARGITSRAKAVDGGFLLSGVKKWISYGDRADLVLVVAMLESQPVILLVATDSEGIEREPIPEMFGFRSARLSQIRFNECFVPQENQLGGNRFIMERIVGLVLTHGRFVIAHGALGIAKACLEESLNYVNQRRQFDRYLIENQLTKRKISNMVTEVKAASLLCQNVCQLHDSSDPKLIQETAIAKYFATNTASDVANEAMSLHGANGFTRDFPLARFLRDAKILETIEGSNEMHQLLIADFASQIEF